MAKNHRSSRLEKDNRNAKNPTQSKNLALERLTCDQTAEYGPHSERRQTIDRRSSFWWALLYGNFRPRRRRSRRDSDHHLFLVDWHEPRILYLSLCVLLLSCTDALFTLNLLQVGADEANVFMASMLERGVDLFVAVKIGLTATSLLVLAAVARRKFFRSYNVEHLLKVFCAGYIQVIYYEVYLFRYVFEVQIF